MWFITLMKYLTMAICISAIAIIVYRILTGKIKNDVITPKMKVYIYCMVAVVLFLVLLRIYETLP